MGPGGWVGSAGFGGDGERWRLAAGEDGMGGLCLFCSPEETPVNFGVDGEDLVESKRLQVEVIYTDLSRAEP